MIRAAARRVLNLLIQRQPGEPRAKFAAARSVARAVQRQGSPLSQDDLFSSSGQAQLGAGP
eukprot:9479740-Pyramimonas_sp.AAC.2